MTLGNAIETYLKYKRSIGYKYNNIAFYLSKFSFFVGSDYAITDITKSMCIEYINQRTSSYVTLSWEIKHTAINGFFKWAVSRGFINQNPVSKERPIMEPIVDAYIFSHSELKEIFNNNVVKEKMKTQYYEVVSTILRVTYMLGLRPKEGISLKLEDIDIDRKLIIIRNTKFYKSRLVPYNDDFAKMLEKYLAWRLENKFPIHNDDYLFLNKNRKPLSYYEIRYSFKRICSSVGIVRQDHYRFGVRLYDLRHTFATERIRTWYKNGDNIQELLSALSTFLGHQHISDTSTYISMTNELLEEANHKFESFVTKS